MGGLGTCCCGACSCDSADSTQFHTLEFDCSSGLHPVTFTNDLWLGAGAANFSAIRANANNINAATACTVPYLTSLGLTRATADKSITDYLTSPNCCMWGVAVPESGLCYSSGTTYDYAYEGGHVRYPSPPNAYVSDEYYNVYIAQSARRYVEGVTIEACYIDRGYGLQLRLKASMSWHDWFDVRISGGYRKLNSTAGTVDCEVFVSGIATVPIPVRPPQCETCITTSPLLTSDGRVYPTAGMNSTCASDSGGFASRTIYLDPDCTIAGTHVFSSGFSGPAPSYVGANPGCYAAGFPFPGGCAWTYGTDFCGPGTAFSPPSGASIAVGPAQTSVDSPGKILMEYWLEDWTITIS